MFISHRTNFSSTPRAAATSAAFCMLLTGGCTTTASHTSVASRATTHAESAAATGAALSLERLYESPPLIGARPMRGQFSADGHTLTFLRPSADDPHVLDLWGLDLRAPDAVPAPLVTTASILKGAEEQLSEAERMRRERKRVRHGGITAYQACGPDGALLFSLGGQLYRVTPGKNGATQRIKTGGPVLDPMCSPLGHYVSFVREAGVVDPETGKASTTHNLYVRYIADGADGTHEIPIGSGDEGIQYGVAEFVAQEEMGRYRGAWWSAGDHTMLFTEVDERPVSQKTRPRIFADRTELFTQRYPAAGESNAIVKLSISLHIPDTRAAMDDPKQIAHTGSIPVALPNADGYVARAGHLGPHDYVLWQSRDQKTVTLSLIHPVTGALTEVLRETDAAYVPLHDDLRALPGERFLWSTDAADQSPTGARVLQIRNISGALESTLALPEGHTIKNVVAVSGPKDALKSVAYVHGLSDRAREQHLWAVPLDGSAPTKLTSTPGWHQTTVHAKTGRVFDMHSAAGEPWSASVGTPGHMRRLGDAGPRPIDAVTKPRMRFVDITAKDGTVLNGMLMEPVGREPGKKYPVIMYGYGGPTGQQVANRWSHNYPLFVHMTQRGYGVFVVDNRGTSPRNRTFHRALHKGFGHVELSDQVDGLDWLKAQPWVDGSRVGFWGWSYGGYLTIALLARTEGAFAAGAAVAPVTDWALYDTHYTERYLGMPQKNAVGYKRAGLLNDADIAGLTEPLLLMHGTADDNVLFEHSLQLIQRLEDAGQPFDLAIYPGRAHGIRGKVRLHMFRMMLRHFDRHLQPESAPAQ